MQLWHTYLDNILLMTSLFCIIMGVLFLFFPRVLLKIVEESNAIIIHDSTFFEHHVKTGIILSSAGIYIIFASYFI